MPDLRPFRGLTPAPGRGADVASPPYDVLSKREAAELCQAHVDSFLHVIRPDALLTDDVDAHGPRAYERAASELARLRSSGALIRPERPALYAYRLQWRGWTQTGIVGLAAVDDYDSGIVKKHEHTRPDKESDRADHIEHLKAQCGPVFLICPASEGLRGWIAEATAGAPVQDFEADEVRHTVWSVDSETGIETARALFASMDATYVADGHHRSAAASVVRRRRRRSAEPGDEGGWRPEDGFLTVTFPADEVQILPYNRAVRDLAGLTLADFVGRLANNFEVGDAPDTPGPTAPGVFDVYLPDGWRRLTARPTVRSADPVDGLDVATLQDHLLAPILGIGDPRLDTRIAFVGGIRGTAELERLVDSGEHAVAFALHATPIDALLRVADSGRVMPPKSTWFEPKLRSGLFVHLL